MKVVVPERAAVEAALRARLQVVAPVLAPELDDSETRSTAQFLHELSIAVKRNPSPERAWLLFIAVSATFPTQPDVDDLLRRLDLSSEGAVIVGVLSATIEGASGSGVALRGLELVDEAVVVDVNFCATNEHNTGIQRVVRETLPHWAAAGRGMRLVAWTEDSTAMRDLDDAELDRVLHWNDRRRPDAAPASGPETVLVPWRSRVLLAEVPLESLCAPILAISQSSGNSIVAIGYDAIPLVSAEGQRNAESERFAHYLAALKHAERVVAISESAANEFRGFVDALASQGLQGPEVDAVPLAVEVSPRSRVEPDPSDAGRRPLVLCVGSHEPRKNQEAVLSAGELLHREGLDFELVFVGGGSRTATSNFDDRVARLRKTGFDIRSFRRLGDDELWGLYARARFTAFVSLHEGFGLPVAESLALGVPALTSNYGSLAEIAALGGCVTVDPRDDEQILAAMRTMLTDDALIERLRAEAAAIPSRGWKDYADELWLAAQLDEVGAR